MRQDTTSKMGNMDKMPMDSMPMMSHSFSRNLPMNRNGSGTSWQPDSTPMYAYIACGGKWNFMFHGSIYLRYTYQDINKAGNRGDELNKIFPFITFFPTVIYILSLNQNGMQLPNAFSFQTVLRGFSRKYI